MSHVRNMVVEHLNHLVHASVRIRHQALIQPYCLPLLTSYAARHGRRGNTWDLDIVDTICALG